MTTVTRKEYDTQGTETVLGLPCKTVTQNWDGAVTSTKMSILDAFNINDIQVDETNRSSSSQSQSLMSLASNIASVKLEERLIPTSFTTPKVMGFPIKSDGSADISAELVEDTLTEVTLTNPITVKGIPVYKIWKGSDNVSFFQIESSAIMDGRATMQGYKTEGASECVYSALSASDASAIGSLVGKTISNGNVTIDGELNEESITSNKYIAIAFNAKKAMDSICGIGLVGVGVNGGVTVGVINAISIGIPANIAAKHFMKGFYNTDGLVFMLDMCYGCSAEKWTDLVGKNEFVGSGVTLQDGVPYFNGSAYMSNSGMAMHNSNTHTIEIVYKGNNASYSANHVYREDFTNGLCAGMYGSSFITITGNNKTTYNVGVHNIVKAVSVSNIAVSNGVQVQSNGTDNWGGNSTNKSYIGSRYAGNQCFTGKIAAIRIYNRLLSAEEMIANQTIDLARFGNM